MIYLAILFIIGCLVSMYIISDAEDKYNSAIVYGTNGEAMKAKKKLEVLFKTCLCVMSALLLITICVMMKPN